MKYEFLIDHETVLADEPTPVYFAVKLQAQAGAEVRHIQLRLEPLKHCESIEPLDNYPVEMSRTSRVKKYFLNPPHESCPLIACFLLELKQPLNHGHEPVQLLGVELSFSETGINGGHQEIVYETISVKTSDNRGTPASREVLSMVSSLEARKVVQTLRLMHEDGQDQQALRILERHIHKWNVVRSAGPCREALQELAVLRMALSAPAFF